MNQTSSFPQTLTAWLFAQDDRYKIDGQPVQIGTWMRVRVNEQNAIEILAVELDKWAAEESLETWTQFVRKVRGQRKNGFKCVIIWENDWWSKNEIVKSRLNAMLGRSQRISARLTEISRIDRQTCYDFLQKNHLNWPVAGKYRYALWLPNRYYRTLSPDFQPDQASEKTLVAVATFSHPRVFLKNEKSFRSFELLRFANLSGTHVTGGLTRLIQAFIRERQPDDIMTYADLEWSEGEGYRQAGFAPLSETPLIDFQIDTKTMERITLQEMQSDQHIQAWNAGSIKYVKTMSHEPC